MQSPALRPASIPSQRPGLVWLVYFLAFLKLILPFILQHPVYEPHRDEFLYLAEGRHPAWGYLEAPPLLAVFSFISNAFGGGFFWIKFWPALFGAMTYVLVGRMILLLGGGRFALLLGFLPFVFGVFLRVHFILSPDFLGVYFQTLMVFGLVKYIRTDRVNGLYLTGLGFGLGMLSQYTVLLFTACLAGGLMLTPGRRVLKSPHFYLSFLMGLLLFIPNGFWQAMHGWPAIHLWGEHSNQQMESVRDQFLYQLPSVIILGAGLYRVFGTAAGKEFRFAGWTALGVLAALVLLRGRPEDGLGVYPVLFAFGAAELGRVRGSISRSALVGFSVLAGAVMDTVFLPMLPPKELAAYYSRVPVFRQLGFLRWADGRDHALPQDFANMLGWEEMAMKTARAYESLDSLDKTGVLLNGGGNCGENGALDYYGPKYSLPPVMGCASNYALWTPAAYYDRDLFIVTTRDRRCMNKFASATIVDSVTHPFSTEYGSYIILMRGPNAAVRQEWKKR